MGFIHLLSILLGRYVPGLFGFQDEDVRRMFPFLKNYIYRMLVETGYAHIQATVPDTVGKTKTPFELTIFSLAILVVRS